MKLKRISSKKGASMGDVNQFKLIPKVKAVQVFKGIDIEGNTSLVIIFNHKPELELKTAKMRSKIVEKKEEFRLFVSLQDDEEVLSDIFGIFVTDIVDHLEKAKDEAEVVEIVGKRFNYWSELFKKVQKNRLDEKWIRGFWGELYFLDKILITKLGAEEAVKSWVGPEKTNQDFITNDKIFEIKTCLQNANTVKISNNNQLSRKMYLTVLAVAKSSEMDKDSLNLYDLIEEISKKLTNATLLQIFQEKLLKLELFPIESAKIYDAFAYKFEDIEYHYVSDEFPFIDNQQVPSAILKYSYELILSEIEKFVVQEEDAWS